MSHPLFEQHESTLEGAIKAIETRAYWSAYPEVPSGKIYGETARKDGLAGFERRLNERFDIDQPHADAWVGGEHSPYGMSLGISYPKPDLDALTAAATTAIASWRKADIETRVGVCLEILHRLNQRSFEMAFGVMHTTGQGFMMAFQAGGPHAQDRGLEAVAYSYQAMMRTPPRATWSKRVGKTETITLDKTFRIVPRGVGVIVGCSTFPTWNGYPGLFASLATGNAVIVKPHPGAILPLAMTVEIGRAVLREAGFDANLLMLAADDADTPITKELVTHPAVGIVDYTGGSSFGTWVEENATQAVVFTEKAGVNSIIIDATDDMRAMTGNIGFSLCLYSGQMCTTSQNIFIPRGGVKIGGEVVSFDDVAGAIVKAVDWLLSDPARGAEILGAIQNERTLDRVTEARAAGGTVVRESTTIENEIFPTARTASPLIIKVDGAADERLYMREVFGPVVYLVATDDTTQSIDLASRISREQGAITCAIYATDPDTIARAEEATALAGVPLSCNLTGSIWVNQSAAFSDFHVSGANPSGNATLCDDAFVASRFRVVQSRIPVATPAAVASTK